MNYTDRRAYLDIALSQIPRVLSLQDRNPLSKTYGSFNRAFWFHRTSDFPSAINQMGVHTLALLWKHPFENNPYYQNPKILQWCLAGIRYWISLQHKDGSFDEWYPNERGWAGPTGYLIHAMADTYFLLGDAFPDDLKKDFIAAVDRAGQFLISYDEKFILANHHAIALLPIYEAYLITRDEKLLEGFHKKFAEFEKYCYAEGWSLEYDGADIGYLSGTISFLSRLYRHWPDERIEKIVRRAVEFTSFFLYPDGYFGGTVGSRQTAHFYHFGYEFWAPKVPMAATLAELGLQSLKEGKLVPPGAQEDHYVLYRLSEYLEAYLTHQPRRENLPLLPWQGGDFRRYFSDAKIHVEKRGVLYRVVSLARGGVIKLFDCAQGRLLENDCGWIVRLDNGKLISSQWNDPNYEIHMTDEELTVSGQGQEVVTKTFTPLTMMAFRIFMLAFGWHRVSAYAIKALIRRMLMVRIKRAAIRFKRTIRWDKKSLVILDEWHKQTRQSVKAVHIGDEIPVRYVPQSRYFQLFELNTRGRYLSASQLDELNTQAQLSVERTIESH